MEEIRCKKCNKLLGKLGNVLQCTEKGDIIKVLPDYEIKCTRCGEMNTNK